MLPEGCVHQASSGKAKSMLSHKVLACAKDRKHSRTAKAAWAKTQKASNCAKCQAHIVLTSVLSYQVHVQSQQLLSNVGPPLLLVVAIVENFA